VRLIAVLLATSLFCAVGMGQPEKRIRKEVETSPSTSTANNRERFSNRSPAKAEVLTEEESAALAKRQEQPGPEVTGGALSNQTLTYIVIALAAAVLVLVLK
jgi:hypothetical protein